MRLPHIAATVAALLMSACTTVTADCSSAPPRERFATSATIVPDAYAVAAFALQENEVANTVCWAHEGDKYAQFALGLYYERGPERDLARARGYYERAARSEPGQVAVYSAPVAGEQYGTIISVPTGRSQGGLAEARAALQRIRLE